MKTRIASVEIDRPWNGQCATTGATMEDFAERVNDRWMERDTPDWIKRAAVSICRSYGIRGLADPAYICNVITRHWDETPMEARYVTAREQQP